MGGKHSCEDYNVPHEKFLILQGEWATENTDLEKAAGALFPVANPETQRAFFQSGGC